MDFDVEDTEGVVAYVHKGTSRPALAHRFFSDSP